MKFYLQTRKRVIFTARFASMSDIGSGETASPEPVFQQRKETE